MSELRREPTDVGPITGGTLRASDSDREQVATVLSTAYAEGRITRDEHDDRLGLAMTAKTFDELLPLTSDLVPIPGASILAPVEAPTQYPIDAGNASADTDNMVAVFGGVTRSGRWRVHKQTRAIALFGGIDLDLRDAVFEAQQVEISGFWCFGGLDIKVPAGMEVRDQTAGIFGGTDVRDLGEPQTGAPVLVIKGMTMFGGVSVHGPKPEKKEEAMNPGQMRVSHADRDLATEVLQTAYAEGRITRDEHDERTAAALTAKTFDDLTALTADLAPGAVPLPLPTNPPLPAATGEADRLTAIFAASDRKGPWRVPAKIHANTMLGSVELDFNNAVFDSLTVEINCSQILGSIEIKVAQGTTVVDRLSNVLGDSSVKRVGDPQPGLPTLVLTGTNVLGDVSVRGPKPPSRWRRVA